MSHFIASMPAAGLIEMPPVSKVTPLPTKAVGAPPSSPPFQLQHEQTRIANRTLGDAEERAHAELFHRRAVEHLKFNASAFERRADAFDEAFGINDVGRLGDQLAGQLDPLTTGAHRDL